MEEKKMRETQISSEDLFNGVILNVKRDQIRLPNGQESFRELIRHVGAVCVVPVTDDGKVVVERQYRYPIDQVITEIPAGKLDSREEDRLHAAQRELKEETGITADRWTDMGLYYPAAAYSDEPDAHAVLRRQREILHRPSGRAEAARAAPVRQSPDAAQRGERSDIPEKTATIDHGYSLFSSAK
jgi:8-oxo-dGTP pyrophosphatase MutT (NUDIX family)